jgi:predicted DNA-binding WGR domain protein
MYRFYEVHVQSTLLDTHAVICTWGSVKSQYHRVRIIETSSREDADIIAQRIIQQKTKKGYQSKNGSAFTTYYYLSPMKLLGLENLHLTL